MLSVTHASILANTTTITEKPHFRLRFPIREFHYLQCVLSFLEVTLVLTSSMEKIRDSAFTVYDDEFCALIYNPSSRCGERRSSHMGVIHRCGLPNTFLGSFITSSHTCPRRHSLQAYHPS